MTNNPWSLLVIVVLSSSISAVFSPPPAIPQTEDSTLGTLVGSLRNGPDLTSLLALATFRPPACLQECMDKMADEVDKGLGSQPVWSTSTFKRLCSQFEVMNTCLAAKPSCNSSLLDITMVALKHVCSGDAGSLMELAPCIRQFAVPINNDCERECRFGAKLLEAATLDAKSDSVAIFDQGGRKLLSVPDLRALCNSSTCFLSCMRSHVDEKCPLGNDSIIDSILETVTKRVTGGATLPGLKASNAYALFVSDLLPRQCRHLEPLSKNIVLTTPRSHSTLSPFQMSKAVSTLATSAGQTISTIEPSQSTVLPAGWLGNSEREPGSFIDKVLQFDGRSSRLQCRMVNDESGEEVPIPDLKSLVTAIAEQLLGKVDFRVEDFDDDLPAGDSEEGKARYARYCGRVKSMESGGRSLTTAKSISAASVVASLFLSWFLCCRA